MALVELGEYNRFITGGGPIVLDHLFDSNVREYEGDVDVNTEIGNTLKNKKKDDKADFWWLNNGITIVADRITGHAKELSIDEPRIVNGLQTSTKIAEYFRDNPKPSAKRHVVIKLIESPDVELQDRIIKATNSQTRIPAQYLWATDDIQRDIEQSFRGATPPLHYARRKNSWRKLPIKLNDVVGIAELAQAVAAIYLQQPDHARARPSRFFKKEFYKRVFSSRYPLELYLTCALVKKRSEEFLAQSLHVREDLNNLLFYVAMLVVCLHLKTPRAQANSIANLRVETIPRSVYHLAMNMAKLAYVKGGATDIAAKGPDMVLDLKAQLVAKFGRKKK